jgi:hypothetical protein
VIRLVTHRAAFVVCLLSRMCVLCMARSFVKIIPIAKLSQPMVSWDFANSWKIGGRLSSTMHAWQVLDPRLWRYNRSRACSYGWVLFLPSHCSTVSVDWWNALLLPYSGHRVMCVHVSLHSKQLGHNGLHPSWFAKNFIVPVTLRTCFAAHI